MTNLKFQIKPKKKENKKKTGQDRQKRWDNRLSTIKINVIQVTTPERQKNNIMASTLKKMSLRLFTTTIIKTVITLKITSC